MLTPTEALIQKLYHYYRHTSDIDQGSLFFSPTCMQICRPIPSYAATTRAQIVQHSKDAQEGNVPVDSATSVSGEIAGMAGDRKDAAAVVRTNKESSEKADANPVSSSQSRSVYTIRPLRPTEQTNFSDDTITSAILLTTSQLQNKSRDEKWIGMRVDLWEEGVATEESLLVKVQYWWRREPIMPGEEMEGDEGSIGWRQCLHDIMYLGVKDGTEGEEGLEVREREI